MLGELEGASPDTYRVMFTERNARWADWIAARMQTPGTVFVAVGAGHLAGKDSVLVRLAERGISLDPGQLTSTPKLAFPAPCPRAPHPRPWSSLEAWRGLFFNRSIAK